MPPILATSPGSSCGEFYFAMSGLVLMFVFYLRPADEIGQTHTVISKHTHDLCRDLKPSHTGHYHESLRRRLFTNETAEVNGDMRRRLFKSSVDEDEGEGMHVVGDGAGKDGVDTMKLEVKVSQLLIE